MIHECTRDACATDNTSSGASDMAADSSGFMLGLTG